MCVRACPHPHTNLGVGVGETNDLLLGGDSRQHQPHVHAIDPTLTLLAVALVICVWGTGKAHHAPKQASCVDHKLYTCSGDFDDEKGVFGTTDLCTGDQDTWHCCEGTAFKIVPDGHCTHFRTSLHSPARSWPALLAA